MSVMPHFFILLLLVLLWPVQALAMQPNGCPDYDEPLVQVRQLSSAPQFNNSTSLPFIRKLAIEGGQNISSGSHETPVGLTAASLKLDSRYEIRIKQTSTDVMVCAQISSFELNFGFDDTVIYLAKELEGGSCSYREVLEHEMRHVRTDHVLVQNYMPLLPDLLRRALKQVGVIRASSPEVAETQIKATIKEYMANLGESLSQVRKKQQVLIDTPQEYERLSKSCNNDLAQLIRRAKEAGL